MASQSWDVIDLQHTPRAIAAARSINTTTVVSTSSSNTTSASDPGLVQNGSEPAPAALAPHFHFRIEKVTFAPGRYCFHRGNATRECHEYAFLLNRIGSSGSSFRSNPSSRASVNGQAAVHAASEQEILKAGSKQKDAEHERIDRVLNSWCMIQDDGSWFVQGAESMLCLVVLDISLYTMVFWVLFGLLATFLSLAGCLWPVLTGTIEPATAFCSYTTAMLGFFLLVEWWGYGAYFIDVKYLRSLALAWRYGSAFKMLGGSVLLSMVAARITLRLSISTRTNYAQLVAAPPPPSSETLSTPRSEGVAMSPSVSQGRRRDECQDDEHADPLQCPANYHV